METTDVSLEQLEMALRRLPEPRRKTVLLFIEFLEYLMSEEQNGDDAEDADLWAAVLAHQAYRQTHADEKPEIFDSAESFMRATADL